MMVQRKKIIQTGVIILLSVLYLNLNAKPHTFLKNSSIGLSYNNGIYFANRSFINNRYIVYTTKPSLYYGFGLNYFYQFKPQFAIIIGYNANLVENNDKYDFYAELLNKEQLNSKYNGLVNGLNDFISKGVSFVDNKFNISFNSTLFLTRNLGIEFISGCTVNYTRSSFAYIDGNRQLEDSIYLKYIQSFVQYNPHKKVSFSIIAGLDFKYTFKNAGALKVKILFNGNLSKSKDEGTITLFPKSSIETSSPYIVNHSHIDFSLEYILPHFVKRKHKR